MSATISVISGLAEGTGSAIRHVGADELEQFAHGFLRETLPEWIAHEGRLAFCRKRMTTGATLAEGRHATGGLSLRVHTVPDGPARDAGLRGAGLSGRNTSGGRRDE